MLIYIGIGIFIFGVILRAMASVQWFRELKRRVMTPLQQQELASRYRLHRSVGLGLEIVGSIVTAIPIIAEMT